MKKKLLFFIFLCLPINSYTMLIQFMHQTKNSSRRARAVHTNQTPVTQLCSYIIKQKPSQQRTLSAISIVKKNKDLSDKDLNTLYFLTRIMTFDKKEYHSVNPKNDFLLHSITRQNNDTLLNIALMYGLNSIIDAPNKDNNSPLYVAATNAYTSLVNIFINTRATLNLQNEHGRTAFLGTTLSLLDSHSSPTINAFFNIIILLIEAGANPFIADNYKKTANDYIGNALKNLENKRQRTIYNEQGDLIHFYQSIRQLLKE